MSSFVALMLVFLLVSVGNFPVITQGGDCRRRVGNLSKIHFVHFLKLRHFKTDFLIRIDLIKCCTLEGP